MKPRLPIRRFDVFAEYNRLKALGEGQDEAHAKGYGLWVAKVVASGGGRRATSQPPRPKDGDEDEGEKEDARPEQPKQQQEWHVMGGEAQTDEMFDQEIIRRMGNDFYYEVFAPAIAEAFEQGKRYESIRDAIRKDWKPGP